MTTGMPELGSKISLISKADIRYEGRLFTVDPQECTIALASVRSFGTEERETQYPVPAQNQVYDYILFRGSDIKDIRVINNVAHPQPLNDPAIMQLSVPPTLGGQTFQGHPVLGPMGPQMGQFAGAYGAIGGAMGGLGMGPSLGNMQRDSRLNGNSGKPSELIMGGPPPSAPGVLSPPIEPPVQPNHASVLDLIGGSRSTTPLSVGSRKSPTAEQGVQAGGSGPREDKKVVKPIQPPGQNKSGQQQGQNRRPRERRGSSKDRDENRSVGNRPQQNNQGYHQNNHGYHHQNSQGGYHQNAQGYPQNNQSYQHQGYNYRMEQHNQSGSRGNWANRGQQMRPRGRPRGGGYRNNSSIQGGNGTSAGNRTKNTLKFENDYDFEQANTEFEELRSQLGKVKIEEASSASVKSEANGDVGDKKDDSGNETGAGDTEQEEEQETFYDKKKSFFDKISCEAVERAKGKSQRTDWRVERKLNSETFGVSSTRRGHYRGRGGYRGVGYRGGYRQNNYRQPQRNNRDQPSAPQQQQQQVK